MSTGNAAVARTPAKVPAWCPYPNLYEINTWIWLSELSRRAGKRIDLCCVPSAEWDAITTHGFDAVWFMGVWERSPAGIAIANHNEGLLEDFKRALPDFRLEDNVGSPYCVRNYVVDRRLGGPEGLAIARSELATRGLKLILDFVPNHVAPDHPWAAVHPEYFIRGSAADVARDPSSYVEVFGTVYALGRDPYFPAWPDVLQLNAYSGGLREAVIDTLSDVAEQSDGVRCDMAMLVMNPIFARTWGHRAGSPPATEYWSDVIAAIKDKHPEFLFIAEAYWDLEWELQQQGFDFCYDKKLYDRLEHANAEDVRLHLCADSAYQNKLLRFIENHDEPRAAATFSMAKEQVSAVTIATIPGARLFHEGQFEGRKVRLPVFLGRRPDESPDYNLQQFYSKLMDIVSRPIFREGYWALCNRTGWPGNATFQNVIAWTWLKDEDRYLIAVNLSDRPAQARVCVPWPDARSKHWTLIDELSGTSYERDGDEMSGPGLYVDLGPWCCHLLHGLEAKRNEPVG